VSSALLSGYIADQAALHGVLARVRDLNFTAHLSNQRRFRSARGLKRPWSRKMSTLRTHSRSFLRDPASLAYQERTQTAGDPALPVMIAGDIPVYRKQAI
jgi:hypothetical protein